MLPFHPSLKAIQGSSILVVDDLKLNRELILSYLNQEGFYNVNMAANGVEALEKTKVFNPDLIILDLIMPQLSGLDVLRTLRADTRYAQVPILVQTIIENPEQRSDAWKLGATDILTKPINRIELMSRIHVHLNNIYQIRELEHYHSRTQEDVTHALELQRLLLPSTEMITALEEKHTILIKSLFIPSQLLSGDLWGLIDIDDQRLGVWIADFSGKGIRAALNTFRLHTLIQEYKYCADVPSEFLDALNQRLVKLMPLGQFATFLLAVIDFKENRLHYAAASSPHLILYHPDKREYALGDATGLPLGIQVNEPYPLRSLRFSKGQSLVLYSDLLWEEKAIPGISLLENQLEEMVRELGGRLMADVFKEQLLLLGDISLVDDLTFIEIHRCL